MNTTRLFRVCVVAGLLTAVISCTSKDKNIDSEKTEVKKALPVKVVKVNKESINRNIDFTASLVPFEEVHLAPASPGKIEKINVEIGDNVAKDQIVALMDRTNLQQAQINLMNVETNYRRLDTLKKTNSVSDQQYDQIKTAYNIAQNSYQFLLENTQLKAPFSGVVSGKYFEDGEIYSGAPVAAVGKAAILSIVQINQLKALIGVSANYFPLISLGLEAEIKSELYPDINFKGEVFRIYPTIDNATKTFTVEVKIQNDKLKLRPGMFAKIQLNLGKGDAILLPIISLVKQTGTNNMYVFVNDNNIAKKVLVKTGQMVDDKIEIIQGIKEGDEVVILGQNKLEDQSPLSIIK